MYPPNSRLKNLIFIHKTSLMHQEAPLEAPLNLWLTSNISGRSMSYSHRSKTRVAVNAAESICACNRDDDGSGDDIVEYPVFEPSTGRSGS